MRCTAPPKFFARLGEGSPDSRLIANVGRRHEKSAASGFGFLRGLGRRGQFGLSLRLVAALILLSGLIAITGIDLDYQIIPDVLSIPGIVAGLLWSFTPGGIGWKDSILGVVIGGGVFVVIIVASSLVLGQPGMGVGDVKLGAMLGAFLGWQLALLSILLSVLVGGLLAAVLLASGRKARKDPLPFGPFLALGGMISLFWGNSLLAWYFTQFLK